jgi:hypothetical protein
VIKVEVKIVSRYLALQREQVKGVEYIEGETSNRPNLCCWEYACTKQLDGDVRPAGTVVTTTALNVGDMDSACIHKCEVFIVFAWHLTRVAGVSEIQYYSQSLEGNIIEKVAVPELVSRQRWINNNARFK